MYRPGEHLVICDICGFRKRRSQCKKNWMGQIVCADTCFEKRDPQETARVKPEKSHVKDARPEHADRFLEYGDVTGDDL